MARKSNTLTWRTLIGDAFLWRHRVARTIRISPSYHQRLRRFISEQRTAVNDSALAEQAPRSGTRAVAHFRIDSTLLAASATSRLGYTRLSIFQCITQRFEYRHNPPWHAKPPVTHRVMSSRAYARTHCDSASLLATKRALAPATVQSRARPSVGVTPN
jgi:hypothetical protein